MIHGHQKIFFTLQVFIQQFLNEKLSFLTFLLSDQLRNNHFNQLHQREIPIPKSNKFKSINKRSSLVLDQKRFHTEPLNNLAVITRELDKGRRAKTTSIKTLPTLVPFVMCFDCKKIA
jgi:hypothetical protein